ncbi:MAG: carbohydrate ABC transporter permease [Ruminococcaceae bacterium]|nr:carbohydrate ABC transporter permease [Oscillospiraceae bacterium]
MDFIKKLLENPALNIRRRKRMLNTAWGIASYVFKILILLAIGYIVIYPLFYMIVTSLRDKQSFYASARVWIPSSIDPVFNYTMAIEATNFFNALKSTLTREIIAAVIEIVTCSIVAYGFARFKFKLKPVLMAGLFLTILIPETMIIIPRMVTYSNVDFFGILGGIEKLFGNSFDITPSLVANEVNFLAFWLPSLFAMGLRSGILIYIYIQFFKGLPYELEEASWVDGAGPIRTFVSIALPSSSVVFTTVTVFSVIWHWNDSLLASMYMKDNYPLAVQLERIQTYLTARGYTYHNRDTMAIMMAGCVLFIIPMLIFYMILQRRFIESIDRVGITG